MEDTSQTFTSCQGDETEGALLSAVHAAREKFEAASLAERDESREAYGKALMAFSAHVCANFIRYGLYPELTAYRDPYLKWPFSYLIMCEILKESEKELWYGLDDAVSVVDHCVDDRCCYRADCPAALVRTKKITEHDDS